jgi:hypothetical protein
MTMKQFFTSKLPLLLLALLGTSQGEEEPANKLFSYQSDSKDWDYCDLEYSDVCEPTVSIEQAACEAPLVVYGRVQQFISGNTTDPSYGHVEIRVDYRSPVFGEQRKGIPKWGAGLENPWDSEDTESPFYRDSGSFSTWVTGVFNNEAVPVDIASDGISSCGTKSPSAQAELYFFLEAIPDNAGVKANISEAGVLNINFTLSNTVLRSGTAHTDLEAWDYVSEGIISDDFKLKGDCQPVYCCYNPDCDTCSSEVFEKYPNFRCAKWTPRAIASASGATTFGLKAYLLLAIVGAVFSL